MAADLEQIHASPKWERISSLEEEQWGYPIKVGSLTRQIIY